MELTLSLTTLLGETVLFLEKQKSNFRQKQTEGLQEAFE